MVCDVQPLIGWVLHYTAQVYEFCRTIHPNLDNYESDGVRSEVFRSLHTI